MPDEAMKVPLASAEEHKASCAGFQHRFPCVWPLIVPGAEFGALWAEVTALPYQLAGGCLERCCDPSGGQECSF